MSDSRPLTRSGRLLPASFSCSTSAMSGVSGNGDITEGGGDAGILAGADTCNLGGGRDGGRDGGRCGGGGG